MKLHGVLADLQDHGTTRLFGTSDDGLGVLKGDDVESEHPPTCTVCGGYEFRGLGERHRMPSFLSVRAWSASVLARVRRSSGASLLTIHQRNTTISIIIQVDKATKPREERCGTCSSSASTSGPRPARRSCSPRLAIPSGRDARPRRGRLHRPVRNSTRWLSWTLPSQRSRK